MNTSIKKYVNDLLKKKPNPVILEIGAHYGEDTMDMLNVFDNPTIHCFDPHPGNAAFMRKLFDDDPRVIVHELALSAVNGQVSFNVIVSPLGEKPLPSKYDWIGEQNYRNFMLNDSGGCSLKCGYRPNDCQKITVESLRLDSWNKNVKLEEIDFIWMDVQGAERDVVEGGKNVFAHTKYVWTEFGETHYEGGMSKQETIDFFEIINFRYLSGDKFNMLMENTLC